MMKEALANLVQTMKEVDATISKIQDGRAVIEDQNNLRKALLRTVDFGKGRGGSLSTPADLIRGLSDATSGRMHLQIRTGKSDTPSYYLFRCAGAGSYYRPIILADDYMSPSYPADDPILFLITDRGIDRRYLRLSGYRGDILKSGLAENDKKVDDLLIGLGAGPLGAAVHPDQLLARAVSRAFKLPHFIEAVELCYLILCARFSVLKNTLDSSLVVFIEQIYGNRPMAGFLKMVSNFTGRQITGLRAQAKEAYAALSTAFRTFLDSQVDLKTKTGQASLSHLVFANYHHLPTLASDLVADDSLAKIKRDLEECGDKICLDFSR